LGYEFLHDIPPPLLAVLPVIMRFSKSGVEEQVHVIPPPVELRKPPIP